MANSQSKKQCYICFVEDWFMEEVKGIYRVHNLKDICQDCGHKADRFVNYYGKKKRADLINLKAYLNDCHVVRVKYMALMNGGYY